jgi:hypothetical protein
MNGDAVFLLPEPPATLAPTLRRLAVTAFDLEMALTRIAAEPVPIDDEMVALGTAMQELLALIETWGSCRQAAALARAR